MENHQKLFNSLGHNQGTHQISSEISLSFWGFKNKIGQRKKHIQTFITSAGCDETTSPN